MQIINYIISYITVIYVSYITYNSQQKKESI